MRDSIRRYCASVPYTLALLAALAGGCRELPPRSADSARVARTRGSLPVPSIVVVSIDTLRSDRLAAYGPSRVETPALDRLESDGVVVERAYTPVPLTLPSHSSLFTGLLPNEHGVRDNAGYRLAEDISTLAEEISKRGYETAGAVSAFVLRRETGIAQGFDHWDDEFVTGSSQTLAERQRSGIETLEAVRGWLDEVKPPFFLFLHLFEPHDPYEPPEPFASRYRDPYDGEIAAADMVLGRLLAELDGRGSYDDSLIVVLSDHGEGLGDHGEEHHGFLLHREVLQVPLFIKLPGGENAGQRLLPPVDLTDVHRFLLWQAGAVAERGVLAQALAGEPVAERPLYAETVYPRLRFGWSDLRSVVLGSDHLVLASLPELYDLVSDPMEQHDLSAQNPIRLRQLTELVDQYPVDLSQQHSVSREDREALETLGYISGVVADDESVTSRPHPREKIWILQELREGIAALRAGRTERAIELFQRVLAEAPESIDALQMLGLAFERTGQLGRAVDAFQRAYTASAGRGPAAAQLAQIEVGRGRFEEALFWLREAQRYDPEDQFLAMLETHVLARLGRSEQALETARRNSERFVAEADVLHQLAVIEMGQGLVREAEKHLRSTLEVAGDHQPALSDLAVLLTIERRFDEAGSVFERALSLAPEDLNLNANFQRFQQMGAGFNSSTLRKAERREGDGY